MIVAAYILGLLSCVLLILWIHAMDRAEAAEQALKTWTPTRKAIAEIKPPPRELVPLVPAVTRKKHAEKWN